MKIIKNLFIMALAGLALASCADLDTVPMGSTITADQKEAAVAQNPERVAAGVAGITSMFSTFGKVLGDDFHNDFGYASLMLMLDGRGMDFVSEAIGYNWFSGPVTMISDWDIAGGANELTWGTLYNQIYAANALLGSVNRDEQLEAGADPVSQFYVAQALAIRAFDYFHLAQMYQQTYIGNEDKPCVPVITEENAARVAEEGCPRSSVEDVYTMIMTDLSDAITMLESAKEQDVTSSDKRYVSAAVAHGLRARVELVMNLWAEAAADAKAAIDGFEGAPLSIEAAAKPGFKDIEETNWMWGIKIAETDRVVTTGICNFPSHMGSLNYGYASVGAWRRISEKLYAGISKTDARKGWWLDENMKSKNLTKAQQKYVKNKEIPAYTQVKFAPYKDELGTSTNANDIPLMRIEEMYLIQAEATAMAGDAANGKTLLTDFVKTYRDPSYTTKAASAEEVQLAVWNQRRIELWGEGLSYFDILRLQQPIDRRGAGFEEGYVYYIEPGDGILIYQIPKVETEANKQIDGLKDNNPIPSVPDPVQE